MKEEGFLMSPSPGGIILLQPPLPYGAVVVLLLEVMEAGGQDKEASP